MRAVYELGRFGFGRLDLGLGPGGKPGAPGVTPPPEGSTTPERGDAATIVDPLRQLPVPGLYSPNRGALPGQVPAGGTLQLTSPGSPNGPLQIRRPPTAANTQFPSRPPIPTPVPATKTPVDAGPGPAGPSAEDAGAASADTGPMTYVPLPDNYAPSASATSGPPSKLWLGLAVVGGLIWLRSRKRR